MPRKKQGNLLLLLSSLYLLVTFPMDAHQGKLIRCQAADGQESFFSTSVIAIDGSVKEDRLSSASWFLGTRRE